MTAPSHGAGRQFESAPTHSSFSRHCHTEQVGIPAERSEAGASGRPAGVRVVRICPNPFVVFATLSHGAGRHSRRAERGGSQRTTGGSPRGSNLPQPIRRFRDTVTRSRSAFPPSGARREPADDRRESAWFESAPTHSSFSRHCHTEQVGIPAERSEAGASGRPAGVRVVRICPNPFVVFATLSHGAGRHSRRAERAVRVVGTRTV